MFISLQLTIVSEEGQLIMVDSVKGGLTLVCQRDFSRDCLPGCLRYDAFLNLEEVMYQSVPSLTIPPGRPPGIRTF